MRGDVIFETEKAYKIRKKNKKIVWIPKSWVERIEHVEPHEDGYHRYDKIYLKENKKDD